MLGVNRPQLRHIMCLFVEYQSGPIESLIFTALKRSLGQGNIFAPVCHSVHGEGEYLGRYPGQVHPRADTLPRAGTPLGRYTSRQVHPPAGTPLGRYTSHLCMLGYGQQAGGTHHTGMHSCLSFDRKKALEKVRGFFGHSWFWNKTKIDITCWWWR